MKGSCFKKACQCSTVHLQLKITNCLFTGDWLLVKVASKVDRLPSLKTHILYIKFPTLVFQLIFQPCRAQKSKSAKASCCSAERLRGLDEGDRIGWSCVNSLSKLLTSMDSLIDGRNGGFTFLASRASQSMVCKTTLY